MRKITQHYLRKISDMDQRRILNFEKTIAELDRVFQHMHARNKVSYEDAKRAAHLMIVSGTYTLDLYLIIFAMAAFSISSGAIMIPGDEFGALKPLLIILFLVLAVFASISSSRSIYIISLMRGIPLWGSRIMSAVLAAVVVSSITFWMGRQALGIEAVRFWEIVPSMLILYLAAQLLLHLRLAEFICFNTYQKRHEISGILSWLPSDKRGKLVALSAQDHYVNILTDRGSHLHRVSMKEAIDLAPEKDGMQVHRSHWVAYKAMLSLNKNSERFHLELRNGMSIPVAKTKVEALRSYLDTR